MVELSVMLGMSFALFCLLLVLAHSVRVRQVTLLDWSLLGIGGMYGLGWIIVLLVTQNGGNPTWQDWINPFSDIYVIHTIAAFLLVAGMMTGWYLPCRLLPRTRKVVSQRYSEAGPWVTAFWIMLLLAVVIQGLYSRAYGGYLGVLDYSAPIRSALYENVPHNPWSFLRPFGGLAMIAAYGFFGLSISGRRTAGVLLGLSLSFLFSVYILYSWLGRVGFVVFLLTFILGVVLSRRPGPLRLIAWAGLAFVGLLMSVYAISLWLDLKAANSLIEFLARELSFPFASFFAQFEHGEHLYRGFVDFVLAPVFLLPSSWWSAWYEPVDQINTAIIMGAPKGEAGVTGSIPVDLLTLGLMQAHVLGVFLVGLIFALLLRILQVFLSAIPMQGLRAVFEAHLALKVAVLGTFYAQPNLVISDNFALIVGSVIIATILSLKRMTLKPRTSLSGGTP